jgi:hypothetical protein
MVVPPFKFGAPAVSGHGETRIAGRVLLQVWQKRLIEIERV